LTEKASAIKNASSIDKIGVGADTFEVRNAATAGSGTGLAVTGAVTIHDGTSGKYTSGKFTGLAADGTGTSVATAVVPGANELTLKIGNAVRTIALDDTAGTDGDLLADMQTKIQDAFNSAHTLAGTDSGAYHGDNTDASNISVAIIGGKIVIEDGGKGADSRIEIVGGNAASVLFDSATDVKDNGNAANNQMTVSYTKDGGDTIIDTVITLGTAGSSVTYNDAQELAAEIESKLNTALGGAAGDITFSADAAGLGESIKWTTATDGKGNGITSITGTAAALAGLAEATINLGEAKNDTLTVNVDGNNYTATIAAQDYSDKDALANAIQSAINTQIGNWNTANPTQPARELVEVKTLSVADTDRVRFQISSGKEGAASNITFTNTELAANLGFDTVAAQGQDGQDASVGFHIGANKDQSMNLAIGDMRSKALGITGTASGNSTITKLDAEVSDVTYGASSSVKNGSDTEYVIDVSTAASANKAVDIINNAIEVVSKERSKLGATQNRLEHTIKNLDTSAENLQASESRIRDVDMAKEMMEFTKNNILSQAAQAMLAQANQAPQGVLQLLR